MTSARSESSGEKRRDTEIAIDGIRSRRLVSIENVGSATAVFTRDSGKLITGESHLCHMPRAWSHLWAVCPEIGNLLVIYRQ